MSNLAIPFCYDRFTTNFFLPDGSYGEVAGGSYTSSGGDVANMLTGDYTLANGVTGNIYSKDESARPDVSNLPLPTPFTSAGVGSAIPASALGDQVTLTYTTLLAGSTMSPVIIPPSTIPDSISSTSIALQITITETTSNSVVIETSVVNSVSTYTKTGSTIPGIALPGSTIQPKLTTITTTEANSMAHSTSSDIAVSTSSKKSSGVRFGRFAQTRSLLHAIATWVILFM